MKIGESFPYKLNIRLSDRQYNYVLNCAVVNNCSVSDIIRECILGAMLESNKYERNNKNENKKNNSND